MEFAADLSIIIINWNSADYVRKCLSSLYQGVNKTSFETIIVDNASYDNCEELVKRDFPDVKFVQSELNIGFAKANNLGFKYSKGRTLLFLNPDTEIIGSAIDDMFSSLHSLPIAGAVGCKLLNTDSSIQTSCIQAFPTIVNQALDIEFLRIKFPQLKLWGIKPLFISDIDPTDVQVISGACMMIKRDIFERVNYFSTDYFMYSEDVDICHKIKLAGYGIYYINKAEVVHHGGGSTQGKQQDFFSTVLMKESLLKFLIKTRGQTYGNVYRVSMVLIALFRLLVISLILPLYTIKNKSLKYTFNKWKKILRWSIGMEQWAKELTWKK